MDNCGMKPKDVRKLISSGKIICQTYAMCDRFVQANLCVLPRESAFDFLLFSVRNAKSCPILEVGEVGSTNFKTMINGGDVCTDFPKYSIYENGVLKEELTDITDYWKDDFIYFLIGSTVSFDGELLESGINIRYFEERKGIPLYNTNIKLNQCGKIGGNMIVSMRPVPYHQVAKVVNITSSMARVHGSPIHIGDPSHIGIQDMNSPAYGQAVTVKEGEVPVFWPSSITAQEAVIASKPPIVITNSPGCMLVTDIKNIDLKY